MKKLICIVFFLLGLMIIKIHGQSVYKSTLIQGDWYACGLKIINNGDTVNFIKTDSICKDNDCLYLKWIIKKRDKFKSGMQQGCGDTKVGFDLKRVYRWSLNKNGDLLIINKADTEEVYQIIFLDDKNIKILRKR